MAPDSTVPTVEAFRDEARAWLASRLEPRPARNASAGAWGVGSDSVEVFPSVDAEAEAASIRAAADWQAEKFDAGFGALTWDPAYGGRGLPAVYERAFRAEERGFVAPAESELMAVTLGLIAPTIHRHGSAELRAEVIPSLLRADAIACQLFSEPGAGSDLASLSCSAERDRDHWILNGQKVWTSGAAVSTYGEAICRTDRSAAKHAGMTAFLVEMNAPGVEVRPIRQMTGGASFNEVFLTDVKVPDRHRIGEVGEGWNVAQTTLRFERGSSQHAAPGGSFRRLVQLAHHLDRTGDPLIRQELVEVYTLNRILDYTNRRITAAARAGETPGPEGSIRKLAWVRSLTRTGEVASRLLGPRIVADTGEWGTFAWSQHVLGAPGYRIAGGSDEIQRNIIAEHVLGLPRDPSPAARPT